MIEIAVAPIFLGLLILRIIRRKYTKKQNTEFLNRISEVASKAAVDAVKKKSSKIKLTDIIFIGYISGKNKNDEMEELWDDIVNKYSSGVIFEKINLKNEIYEELQKKIESINNSKNFKELFENDSIIINKYPKNYPTMFYIKNDSSIEYFKSTEINNTFMENFIDNLIVKKTDNIISGGKINKKTRRQKSTLSKKKQNI